jgi:hypothetical protein
VLFTGMRGRLRALPNLESLAALPLHRRQKTSTLPARRNHKPPQRSQYFSSSSMTSRSVSMIASTVFGRWSCRQNKKPCADCSVAGLVSLTMTCFNY